MNVDELALDLAKRALSNHFDPEAYIVKYIAEKKLGIVEDLVPGSSVDEFIQRLLNLFVIYSNDRTPENLNKLLIMLRQVISELYHTSETKSERDAIKQFILASQKIYS